MRTLSFLWNLGLIVFVCVVVWKAPSFTDRKLTEYAMAFSALTWLSVVQSKLWK